VVGMDRYLEAPKRVKPEVPVCTLWEIYKGYRVVLHPLYGYLVCKPSGYRVNRETYDGPEEARKVIDKLPPPSTLYSGRRRGRI